MTAKSLVPSGKGVQHLHPFLISCGSCKTREHNPDTQTAAVAAAWKQEEKNKSPRRTRNCCA